MYAQFTGNAPANEQWSEQNGHPESDNANQKASPRVDSANNAASMSRENSNSQLGLGFGNELWDMSFLTSSAGNSHNIDTPNSHMMEGMMFGQDMDSNATQSQTFPDMSMDAMSLAMNSSNAPAYLQHLQAYGAFTGKSSESPAPHDDKAMYMPSSTAESTSTSATDSSPQHSFSRARKPGTLSFGSNELMHFDVNNSNNILGINHSQTPEALSPQSANPAMFSPTFMDALNSVNGQTNVFDFANFDSANASSLQPPQSARLAGHRRNSSAASQPSLQHSHQASLDSNTPATPAAAQVHHHSIFNNNQIHSNPATIQPSAMTMVAPPESAFNPTPTFSELMSMERQTSSSSSIYSNGDDTNMAAAAAAFFGRKSSHINGVTGDSPMDQTPEDLMTVKLEPADGNLSVGSVTPNGASTASQGATTPTIMEEEEADHHHHLLSPTMMESYYGQQLQKANGPGAVTQRMMQPANVDHLRMLIRQYLNTPDPLAFGERTVLLMTSKVAQKSYGTEKRFLCPPPTVILLGNNWWASAGVSILSPPRLSISISGENAVQVGSLEWFNRNGDTVEPDSNVNDVAVAGKSVAKQLFINDADEKRKRVEVLVKVQLASATGAAPNPMTDIKSLGQFGSRGIKVISKPSKKRQSVKNMELCIHHGTAISLFNRIRSQTVSTKYLGVSTSSTALTGFTTSTWMPPPQSLTASNQSQGNTCFVARTGSWDPFIIWIVDTRLQSGATDIEGKPPLANVGSPSIGCPPPPAVALRTTTANGNPIPIHYNQPVLLQCLTTGLISPVMIIRKVDKGSMVVGSTAQDDRSDDTIGDPISQLHKVAFQIHTPEPKVEPSLAMADPGESGRYLACLGDVVGMQRAEGTRKWVQSPTPPNALSPASPPSFGNPSDMMPPPPVPNMNAMTAAAWATAQTQYSNSQQNRSAGNASPTELVGGEATANAAGGKTANRRRRVSSSVAVKPTTGGVQKAVTGVAAKNRRRGSSMSSMIKSSTSGDFSELVANSKNKDAKGGSSTPTWTEDVTDSAVWTIVGTDCAKYSFYVPPMDESKGCNPSLPVTPIPVVTHFLAPSTVQGHHHSKSVGDIPASGNTEGVATGPVSASSSGSGSGSIGFVMIYGECFTRDLSVWFGDIPSERTEHRCREVLAALPPPRVNGRLPILLVRADGVIYRTGKYYP